jgi:hypothetical protein
MHNRNGWTLVQILRLLKLTITITDTAGRTLQMTDMVGQTVDNSHDWTNSTDNWHD